VGPLINRVFEKVKKGKEKGTERTKKKSPHKLRKRKNGD